MMRTVDDYKMVITNSAVIVNDYSLGDCTSLERQFSIWDPVCHKLYLLGIYYDKKTRKLYLPRGCDISYLKRKVESSMMGEDLTSTVVRNHDYGYIRQIAMRKKPRDSRQIEALQFMLCRDKYACNRSSTQFGVNLNTGAGKTYCAAGAISYLGITTVIITAQTGILDQWRDRLFEYTDIKPNEIALISGSAEIDAILRHSEKHARTSMIGKCVYLVTHSTLQSYATTHGWESIGELFKTLRIGVKIYDEAHQNFLNMSMVDFYTNVWRTYYLTATPSRSSQDENHIYQLYMKNVPSIELFDEERDPHTKYISIKYNSNPKPMDFVACRNSIYGLNQVAYVNYLMTNERFWTMFDYIFSLIYKAGGKALIYIKINDAILKVRDRIVYTYPELANDIGIYTTISDDKQMAKGKRFILTTTKSAGAGEDIQYLKYSIVLAEPFKSEVLARQTLGRTRDPDTTYIELIDVGFKELIRFYNTKKAIFEKYALSCKNINVDNLQIINFQEETRLTINNRFNMAVQYNRPGLQEAMVQLPDKMTPAVFYADPSMNRET